MEKLEDNIQEKKTEIQNLTSKGATIDNKKREIKLVSLMWLRNFLIRFRMKRGRKRFWRLNIRRLLRLLGISKIIWRRCLLRLIWMRIWSKNLVPHNSFRSFCCYWREYGSFLRNFRAKRSGVDIRIRQTYSRGILIPHFKQVKVEKGDVANYSPQIDDLLNIIAYENANIMNYYVTANQNKPEIPGLSFPLF